MFEHPEETVFEFRNMRTLIDIPFQSDKTHAFAWFGEIRDCMSPKGRCSLYFMRGHTRCYQCQAK